MRILVLQHLRVEHPGVFLNFWKLAGHEVLQVELDEGEQIPNLENFDLLAVMGGPMDVWQEDNHPWLVPEKAAIRRWVKDMQRPYFGVCLGHQLLASALGGRVGAMRRAEVGLASVNLTPTGQRDPILAGFDTRMETFQWHSAEIQALPEGAKILAANSACSTQAIRWGRHAYGFQFHVEMTSSTVNDWIEIPEYRASLESSLGASEAEHLAKTIAPRLASFRETAHLLNENLCGVVARGLRTVATAASPKRIADGS